jgi:putative SOS response-associated peptidase YedK
MCGRYVCADIRTLEREWEIIYRSPGLWEVPIYNAAPTTMLPAVRMKEGMAVVPADALGIRSSVVERGETGQPHHQRTHGDRRLQAHVARRHEPHTALVPVLGYYEWNQTSKPKQPYFIRLPDEPLTCFAGLWSSWRDMVNFTILVGPDAPHLAHIHDRMPLTLPRSAWARWLIRNQQDGAAALAQAQAAALSHLSPSGSRPT